MRFGINVKGRRALFYEGGKGRAGLAYLPLYLSYLQQNCQQQNIEINLSKLIHY